MRKFLKKHMSLRNRMGTEELNVYYNAMTHEDTYHNPTTNKAITVAHGIDVDEMMLRLVELETEATPPRPRISLKKTLLPSERLYEYVMSYTGKAVKSKDMGYCLSTTEPPENKYGRDTEHGIFIEYEFTYDNYFMYYNSVYGYNADHGWRDHMIDDVFSKEELKAMYEKLRDTYNGYANRPAWLRERVRWHESQIEEMLSYAK